MKGDNEEVEHKVMRAKILVPTYYDNRKFVEYSTRIVDAELKAEAGKQGIKNIWVEFYSRDIPSFDQDKPKPYRVKYFSDGGAWVRLARAAKQASPDSESTHDDASDRSHWVAP